MRAAACIAVAALSLAIVPAAALGELNVEFDSGQGTLTIVDDTGASDDLFIQRTTLEDVVTATPGTPVTTSCTPAGASSVACPRADAIGIDLGDGDDRVRTAGVAAPVTVVGGTGDDTVAGGANADVLIGGPGDDVVAGGGGDDFILGGDGEDALLGETGNDSIDAQDGRRDRIDCGAGSDSAVKDVVDVTLGCEPFGEADGDGFSPATDCDDGNAGVFPGAREIPDNAVDEDCDGRDAVNLDRDGDGFQVPLDCDDANAAIRPGALEIRGNKTDENCDRRASPFAELPVVVSNRWKLETGYTRLRTLVVRLAPRGARVDLRCRGRGCPKPRDQRRVVPGQLTPIRLHRPFARARLLPRARLTLRITATESIARTTTFTIRKGRPPSVVTVCRVPGQRRAWRC